MGNNPKILSIDDSLTTRRILKGAVEALGYEFLEAADAMKGLQVLSENAQTISLILLDWNMPGMNGLEFLQKVKANTLYHSIPIIMMTTEAEKESIVKAIHLGVNNYILKPFGNEELTQKMNKCLGRGKS